MSKSPAFQFYAADFLVDTADWTPSQVGAYLRLLLTEWVNGPLSPQMTDLARIAGISDVRTMVKIWNLKVGKKFTPNGGNLLINRCLEDTREEQQKWREKQIESGRLGGLKTQDNRRIESSEPSSEPSRVAKALQSSSSSSPSIKKIKTLFILPTIEDISKYCTERRNGISPEEWFDHYTSNGWMVGKNKMRD